MGKYNLFIFFMKSINSSHIQTNFSSLLLLVKLTLKTSQIIKLSVSLLFASCCFPTFIPTASSSFHQQNEINYRTLMGTRVCRGIGERLKY